MSVRFSFDLGSPYAWLAAERVDALLDPAPVTWEPVLLGGIFAATGRSSWARAGDVPRAEGIAEVERRASERGLRPVTWPEGWPSSYLTVMRMATAAERHGGQELLRRFALAAFRVAFTEGADLSAADGMAAAARAAGIDGAMLVLAAGDTQVKQQLRTTTDAALARGVTGVPAFTVSGTVFWGEDRLDEAAAHAA